MKCFWYWVSNIGSLASVIGFIITIIQLTSVKKELKKSERAVSRLLKKTNRELLETINRALMDEHRNIIELKTRYKQKGTKWKVSQKTAEEIISKITDCQHKLPTNCAVAEEMLNCSTQSLSLFVTAIEANNDEFISDAEVNINGAINTIKKIIEQEQAEELKTIV